MRTLVIGGARSGKSAYAESLLGEHASVRYVATARPDPTDADFQCRIAAHRARRPASWRVVETDDLAADVRFDGAPTLVDDLGTWLTGVLDDADAWEKPRGSVCATLDGLVRAVDECSGRLVLVTPEVGQGIIPATASGRLFRDEIGLLNQRLAGVCDEVVLVVAGLPLALKSKGARWR